MSTYIRYPNMSWKSPVVNAAALPTSGNQNGDARVDLNTDTIYIWNGTSWIAVATPGASTAIDGLTGDVSASGPGVVAATVNSVGGSSAANIHTAELAANNMLHLATPSITIGSPSQTAGVNSFSAGPNGADGAGSLAGGAANSRASGNNSVAWGYSCMAQGNQSQAMGDSNTAANTSTLALGEGSSANAIRSQVIGLNLIANSQNQHVVGMNNVAIGNPVSPAATDEIFTVGNGASSGSRSTAFAILRDGALKDGSGSVGSSGNILTSNGSGSAPTWQAAPASGANAALSNLASTDINADLIPHDAGAGLYSNVNLGSITKPWGSGSYISEHGTFEIDFYDSQGGGNFSNYKASLIGNGSTGLATADLEITSAGITLSGNTLGLALITPHNGASENTQDIQINTGGATGMGANSGNISLDPGAADGTRGYVGMISNTMRFDNALAGQTAQWGTPAPGLILDSANFSQNPSTSGYLINTTDLSSGSKPIDIGILPGSSTGGDGNGADLWVIGGGGNGTGTGGNLRLHSGPGGTNTGGIVLDTTGTFISPASQKIILKSKTDIDLQSVSGNVILNTDDSMQIKHVADPTDPQDAATKAYVDSATGGPFPTRAISASTTISGTPAVIVYSTKDFDLGNNYDNTTGIWTCPSLTTSPSYFQINAGILTTGTIALNSVLTIAIHVNNIQKSLKTVYLPAGLTDASASISDILQIASGDTVTIKVSSTATGPSIVSSSTDNYLSICMVRHG